MPVQVTWTSSLTETTNCWPAPNCSLAGEKPMPSWTTRMSGGTAGGHGGDGDGGGGETGGGNGTGCGETGSGDGTGPASLGPASLGPACAVLARAGPDTFVLTTARQASRTHSTHPEA